VQQDLAGGLADDATVGAVGDAEVRGVAEAVRRLQHGLVGGEPLVAGTASFDVLLKVRADVGEHLPLFRERKVAKLPLQVVKVGVQDPVLHA
jgi:hypothetical protein